MTTKERGKNAGLGKAGKPARADRAAQHDAAREDALLDGAGWTPDPGDGQVPCDEATAPPDPTKAYERVLKRMTLAGASLETDGLHPYDVAARGLRLILTAPEGSELANLREAFTPLAPLPFHVMVRAMELDWRERDKRLPPDSPAKLRWFGELGNHGATIGQMVARLFRLRACFEAGPGSDSGAKPAWSPVQFMLFMLAVDVWHHRECLALRPLPAATSEESATDLEDLEKEDRRRLFLREDNKLITGPWLQFVRRRWNDPAERLLGWLLENLSGSYADRAALEEAMKSGALEIQLTVLLEKTFDESTTKREFAERVFGGIQPFSKVLDAVATKSVAKAERPSRGFREDIIQSEIIKQVQREPGDRVLVLGRRFCAGAGIEKLSAAKVWGRVCDARSDLGWTGYNAFREWFSRKQNGEAPRDRILRTVAGAFLRLKRREEDD